MVLFGLVFIGASIGMSLAFVDFKLQFFENFDWEKLEATPKNSELALKYLFMISGMFFLAGLKVTVSGIQNYLKLQKRKALAKRFRGQPWNYDFKWDSHWAFPRDKCTSIFSHIVGISIVLVFHLILFEVVPIKGEGIFISSFLKALKIPDSPVQ